MSRMILLVRSKERERKGPACCRAVGRRQRTGTFALTRLLAGVLAAVVLLTMGVSGSLTVEAKTGAQSRTALVNSQALTPVATGYAPCDELVNAVLAQITTPSMTTDQKLRACYDYIINICSYGYNEAGFDAPYVEGLDPTIPTMGPYLGWSMLTYHEGVCDNYACAFAALARAIGVNAYTHSGQCRSSKGGYSNHTWVIVKMNGTEYICDPQVEDNITNRLGRDIYDRYMKTYAEEPNEYINYALNWYEFIPTDLYQATGVSRDVFDPIYYAEMYPEVAQSVGLNEDALYQHYVNYGQAEGRFPTWQAEENAWETR